MFYISEPEVPLIDRVDADINDAQIYLSYATYDEAEKSLLTSGDISFLAIYKNISSTLNDREIRIEAHDTRFSISNLTAGTRYSLRVHSRFAGLLSKPSIRLFNTKSKHAFHDTGLEKAGSKKTMLKYASLTNKTYKIEILQYFIYGECSLHQLCFGIWYFKCIISSVKVIRKTWPFK